MGQIPNKTYTSPDGSVYRVEADGSVSKIKEGRIQSNEPPSKYQITPEGLIFLVEADGSVTYLGNAEDIYSGHNRHSFKRKLILWILITIIIAAGAFVSYYIIKNYLSPDSDLMLVERNQATKAILNSSYIVQDGHQLHFYEGQTYTADGTCRDIMIAFCEIDGELKKVIYKNMEFGVKIIMDIAETDNNSILLTGLDGNKNFTIELSPSENDRLVGRMTVGTKTLNVRMMPSLDTFKISHI